MITAFSVAVLLLLLGDHFVLKSSAQAAARASGEAELTHLLCLEQAVLEQSSRGTDGGTLPDVFVELNLSPRIRRALLLNERDLVVASTRRSQIGQQAKDVLPLGSQPTLAGLLDRARSSRRVQIEADREAGASVLRGVCPIALGHADGIRSTRQGIVYVELDLEALVRERERALGSRGLVRFGLLVAIVFFLWLFLYLRVSRRLSRLVEHAERIGLEGYAAAELDATVEGDDEIGDLARALATGLARRRELEVDHERLETAFRQSADPAFICALDGRILFINAAVTRVYGLSPEEVLGKTPRVFKSGTQTRQFYAELWKTLLSGRVWNGRIQNRTKSGDLLDFDVTITPVRVEDGSLDGFYASQRNVTRELELERQLLQSQKLEAVGQLAAGIAHDFNNLLTVIVGSLELVQADSKDPRLEQVREAARRAANLTRQLLEFGRKSVAQREVTTLCALLDDSGSLLGRLLTETIDLNVVCAHRADAWPVLVDPTQLQQVILNLAINARDAMPRGGRLTIDVANVSLDEEQAGGVAETTPGDYVVLSVSDTGVGMAPEVLNAIFDPFFTTKAVGAGTGLGLSTVHGIVKAHRGSIDVSSTLGEGTCFKIYFPRAPDDHVAKEERVAESPPVAAPLPAESRILVVEDEESIRELVVLFLTREGYRVDSAESGEEALALPKEDLDAITLLVSDVVLTGMRGPELARRLGEGRPGLRVLYMSGYTGDEGVLDEGVELLPKPFGPAVLLAKVASVLAGAPTAARAPDPPQPSADSRS